MNEKTVLVIAYYFPPMGLSGVQRTLKFVKYLPEYGWNVIVLTNGYEPYYAYDEMLLDELDSESVYICRTGGKSEPKSVMQQRKFPSYFTQKIGRAVLQTIYIPDSKANWKVHALKAGEMLLNKYEVNTIFATAPPFTDFLVAEQLSKKFNKPYILDYRDAWVDNPFHFYPTPFHKTMNIRLESEVLRKAGKVVVTTRQAKENLIKRYRFLSYDDITIIPHGYDPLDFAASMDAKPEAGKFTITHSGLFQDNRTPKYFFEAMAQFLKENPDAKSRMEARFVGIMRKGHLNMVKKFGLADNVVTTGYLPHKEAVRQLLESDVLWMMLDDTVRTPGKLFEYIGADKPMLICCPDGIIRRIAMDSGAAFAANPKDVKAIKKALGELYELWKKRRLPKPDAEYREGFDRKRLTGELARELALAAYI